MDSAWLNRIGIGVELIGTLLAAPELIDRFLGLRRVEDSLQAVIERSARAGREYFLIWSDPEPSPQLSPLRGIPLLKTILRAAEKGIARYPLVAPLLLLIVIDISIAYASLVLIEPDALAFPWLIAGGFIAAITAVSFILSTALTAVHVGAGRLDARSGILQKSAVFLGAVVLTLLLIVPVFALVAAFLNVMTVVAPISLALALAAQRLQVGWMRTGALVVGVGLFVSGLTMQFVATF